jgi:hypothetical protein
MPTGLFDQSTGHGQALRHRHRQRRSAAMMRFAEALSEHDAEAGDPGGNITAVANKLGMTPRDANAMMQRLRRELGPQAR